MHKFWSPYLYTKFWIPSESPIDLAKTAAEIDWVTGRWYLTQASWLCNDGGRLQYNLPGVCLSWRPNFNLLLLYFTFWNLNGV